LRQSHFRRIISPGIPASRKDGRNAQVDHRTHGSRGSCRRRAGGARPGGRSLSELPLRLTKCAKARAKTILWAN